MPFSTTSRLRSHAASSKSRIVSPTDNPALLTRMSIDPKRSFAAEIAFATEALSATSIVTPRASPPASSIPASDALCFLQRQTGSHDFGALRRHRLRDPLADP